MKITTSKKYNLDWRDAMKGLLMASGTAVGLILESAISNGTLDNINFQTIWKSAVAAAFIYLAKNFLSPSKIVVSAESPVKVTATKDGETEIKNQ